ncbi:erythropoietin-like isoform X1 [Brienomyrus brachyistius]|uniref:erythropoietin-like isoform X1 n=2 Tax=Brienomyrus brachyistius TaxID=42636 RepID=UPI0020B3A94B|nr:erythropoietin-like isoform X1 [Brienomyrus brachyistius]
MRITTWGLVTVLLMVLDWTRPGSPAALRPICDPLVLERFIRESHDTEVAMGTCRDRCRLSELLTVPRTSVDFAAWERKDVQEQTQEVQEGLRLLGKAIDRAKASVSDTALIGLLDSSYDNIHSIKQVIRSLDMQDWSPSSRTWDTWDVSSLPELFRVHTNFLRGKVHLLLSRAPACHQEHR